MADWQDDDVERYSPTVRRRRLGLGLRTLRMARGYTAERAATQLGMSTSALTKVETAERNISKPALMGLLAFYEADRDVTRELIGLHATSRERGWFQTFGVQTGSFIDWECEAVSVRGFEPLMIPGILQTDDYAEAVIAATRPDFAADDRPTRSLVRASRATLIDDPDGPDLRYVVHESALRTVVGGAAVMARQLTHLATRCERAATMTVRVVPASDGAHPGMEGGFGILTFADLPALACVDHMLSTAWFEKSTEVDRLVSAFDRLTAQALPADASVALMRRLAADLS